MYISRSIEPDIKKNLFKGEIVIIYGPRQAGKTTLVKKLISETKKSTGYFNCDEADIRDQINTAGTSSQLKEIIGNNDFIVFDEAQRIENIGLKLKLLVDNFSKQQFLATGSSSFELADKITEPLTGRNFQFILPPLSVPELLIAWGKTETSRQLENLILFGSYPAVVNCTGITEKTVQIKQLAGDNLYKDILKFFNLKGSETVRKLLEGLALQIGQEVSYEELGNLAGIVGAVEMGRPGGSSHFGGNPLLESAAYAVRGGDGARRRRCVQEIPPPRSEPRLPDRGGGAAGREQSRRI